MRKQSKHTMASADVGQLGHVFTLLGSDAVGVTLVVLKQLAAGELPLTM